MKNNPDLKNLPDNPTDNQILLWLKCHKLPEDCLEAVKTWIEACEENRVSFGPGFSISIGPIAISNCGVDFEVATRLDECIQAYSGYSGN